MTAARGEYRERSVRFGPGGRLFGIWTEPVGGLPRVPVVVLGAGILHRVGPSRASVALARALAGRGYPTLRFDLSGIGDSGPPTEASLEAAVTADVLAAIEAASTRQDNAAGHVTLIGFCSGADNALFVGASDTRVKRILLFDPTLPRTPGYYRREAWRLLTTPRGLGHLLTAGPLRLMLRRWAARRNLARRPPGYYGLLVSRGRELDYRAVQVIERGGALYFLLSSGAQHYFNAPKQVHEALPRSSALAGLHWTWAPHLDHVLGTRAQVQAFIDHAIEWIER